MKRDYDPAAALPFVISFESMSEPLVLSRRSFLSATAAVLPLAAFPLTAGAAGKPIPVGLELYSVRDDLKKDLPGTLSAVAKMGYQCVEFYSPYFDWTPDKAKEVRKQLDDSGIRCYSTHNGLPSFTPEGLPKAIELNKILGTKYVVLAHPGDVTTLDGWKKIADTLNSANTTMQSEGLHTGYHNHDAEWKPVEGKKPMELLAASTDKSVMLQLDVGTCLEAGNDPVAWIEKNPGRIRSLHLKDWSPDKGYRVLFGDGAAPWKKICHAAEAKGGVEFYLIEQEGSDHSEMETAQLCLANWHKLRA
jgi:sugar phosphate isomerase/epimerase